MMTLRLFCKNSCEVGRRKRHVCSQGSKASILIDDSYPFVEKVALGGILLTALTFYLEHKHLSIRRVRRPAPMALSFAGLDSTSWAPMEMRPTCWRA